MSFWRRPVTLTEAKATGHHNHRDNHAALERQRKLDAVSGDLSELKRAYQALEELMAQSSEKLNRTSDDLAAELEKCKDAEARLRAVSECFPYGAWICQANGTTQQVSASYLEMLGESADSIKTKPWFSFAHPDDRDRIATLWKEVIAAKAPWNCEFCVTDRNGETRHVLSRGGPLPDSKNSVDLYAGVQLDVTERVKLRDELLQIKGDLEVQVAAKTGQLQEANRQLLTDLADRLKAECALRDSENQLRAIYENALDSMIVMDDQRRVVDGNESSQRLFGMTLEQLRGTKWDDLIPRERLAGVDERWKEFLQAGTKRGEVDVRRADGQPRLVAFSSRANILPGRHLITLRDITEHREAEESLRLLSHRLMHLQEEERRRIARELHDSTGQSLAALRMQLERIRTAVSELPEKARKALDDATETCESCTADIRTISYLLHPPMLDEVGLLPALEWYVAGFRERSGVRISEEIGELGPSLSRDLNTALFRIIQEALTNIHKHAESTEALIRLAANNGLVILEISDNGKGFNTGAARHGSGVKGLGVGITGMRERVRQLGGTLEIASLNPGTLIRAKFPTPLLSTQQISNQQGGENGNT